MIMAQLPMTEMVATPDLMAIVLYRFHAVTSDAAIVVTYMKTIGMPANAGLRRVEASHTVTINRLSAAMSWFDAPNSCHRYTQVPERTRNRTASEEMTVATCWFLNPTHASPSHSPSVTRMTRNTSWTTVSTITTNVPKPMAVP